MGGKGEVVQPGGSYDFRREIDTRGSDGGTSPVVDSKLRLFERSSVWRSAGFEWWCELTEKMSCLAGRLSPTLASVIA